MFVSVTCGNSRSETPPPIGCWVAAVCWSPARLAKSPKTASACIVCPRNTVCGLPDKTWVSTGPIFDKSDICGCGKSGAMDWLVAPNVVRFEPKWPTGGAMGKDGGNGAFRTPGKCLLCWKVLGRGGRQWDKQFEAKTEAKEGKMLIHICGLLFYTSRALWVTIAHIRNIYTATARSQGGEGGQREPT